MAGGGVNVVKHWLIERCGGAGAAPLPVFVAAPLAVALPIVAPFTVFVLIPLLLIFDHNRFQRRPRRSSGHPSPTPTLRMETIMAKPHQTHRPPDATPLMRFWDRDIQRDRRGWLVHPDDAPHLQVPLPPLLEAGLRLPPAPVTGTLVNGFIHLLALNPGHTPEDDERAATEEGQRWWRDMRSGRVPYEPAGNRWFVRKLAWLGPWHEVAPYAVKLNRFAYSSSEAPGPVRKVLRQLPSSRLMLEWASDVLFPAARRGECVVFVTRSHDEWGLVRDRDEGAGLFCSFLPRQAVPRLEDQGRIAAVVREVIGRVEGPRR